MDAYLIQFSVVILGETHNPTILNPDFLAARDIVPEGWETGQVITTPALSIVGYTNGLSITVEPNKLQIVDGNAKVDGDAPNIEAAEVARRYVRTLPHVRYTSVGTNFVGAVELPNPETYLKDRFLKQGEWDSPSHPLTAVGLRLAYSLPESHLLLSLDTGQAERVDDEQEGLLKVVLANANFSRECSEYPATEQIGNYMNAVPDDWTTYTSLLKDVLRVED